MMMFFFNFRLPNTHVGGFFFPGREGGKGRRERGNKKKKKIKIKPLKILFTEVSPILFTPFYFDCEKDV